MSGICSAPHDPDANVVLLPANHYLRDEATMARSLRRAADLAAADKEAVYLLGAEPNGPDSELGYIIPGGNREEPSHVARFVEKPDVDSARTLINAGAYGMCLFSQPQCRRN